MISRVAEQVFWLQRYAERASSLSRLLLVSTSGVLDAEAAGRDWRPVLITAGVHPAFQERYGHIDDAHTDAARVLEFLTWSDECPVSVWRSVHAARENARAIRETISREVWETINREWLWLRSDDAREAFAEDQSGFYRRLRDFGHQFRGAVRATMPHDEPMHFMSLGLYLERADQTARILNVTHYAVPDDDAAPVAATVAWMQALLACGGYEAFFKESATSLRGRRVAAFLLLHPAFPRSVRHCLQAADRELEAIRALDPPSPRPRTLASARALRDVRAAVDDREIDALFEAGIHEELTRIVDGLAGLGGTLYEDFFAPAAEPATPDVRTPSAPSSTETPA